ncbi:hypothetical protein QBC42DRAFT_72406 [Cladorrhinum samala]|uniref:Uncharacterized protein n=1 Tax=Cladorrhinum samala TaxID=585594 RepID=A0AAV9HSH8_9PEZI|nr:hypothetical protein QBC42DRAFT_72406 [Cladorrhinum samala]
MSGPTSHLPSSLQTQWDYTKTLRSSSRLSWDGQFPSPPSPSTSPPPPVHDHYEQHRDRGRDRGRELSRPKSFSNFSQLSANQDRWSYDRIRLSPSGSFDSDGIETPPPASSPQRQPAAHRPVTPEEVQEVLGLARGRAGRSLSPPRSRPLSAYDPGQSAQRLSISSELLSSYPNPLASPSTPMSFSPGGSIPTLRITQPPNDEFYPSLLLSSSSSSLPPSSSVGNRTPQGSLAPTRAPKQQQQLQEPGEQAEPSSRRQKQKQRQKIIEEDVDEPDDACCFGACRRSKVQAAGGRVTGWLLGTLLPVAFGVVMGVVAKATGGR